MGVSRYPSNPAVGAGYFALSLNPSDINYTLGSHKIQAEFWDPSFVIHTNLNHFTPINRQKSKSNPYQHYV